jgi:hypothetical protein
MTPTPYPTLAARLAVQLQRLIDHPSIPNFETLHQSLYDAYRSGQLITLADAETIVRAENEACAERLDDEVKVARDFGPHHIPIITAIASAIRARVKQHNNEVA